MLLHPTIYGALLQPALSQSSHEGAKPDEITARIAFSHICEPSDSMPFRLSMQCGLPELLMSVIDRDDHRSVGQKIGSEVIGELESEQGVAFVHIWRKCLERWTPRLSQSAIIASLEWLKEVGAHRPIALIPEGSVDYAQNLLDLGHNRPFMLWAEGEVGLLNAEQSISIVGTRQASNYGVECTREMIAVAALAGIVTVSGGAFGIDAVVHQSSLALESPTVAFMAGGLGNLYPRSNLNLLKEIGMRGLLVSECPPDVTPAKWRFLMRNRLISALGNATVVVEAGRTSGALQTARTAMALGREVAIVPGQMDSSRSVGCHDFLNQYLGLVKIVARPQDVLSLAGIQVDEIPSERSLGTLEKRALDAFSGGLLELWEIQRLAGLTVRETEIAVSSLIHDGLVQRFESGYVAVNR